MIPLCPSCPFSPDATRARSRWTEDKRGRLRELALTGATGTQIGVELGFSRGAVLGQCHRLGIKLTKTKAKMQHFGARKKAVSP